MSEPSESVASVKTDASVELFETASDAAKQIGESVKGMMSIAGKARSFWSDPSFQTVAELLESASKGVKQVVQAERTLEHGAELGRQLFSSDFSVPPLPKALAHHGQAALSQGAQSAAVTALGHASMVVPGLALAVGLVNLGVGVYNAVQFSRLGNQLGELSSDVTSRFVSVEQTLSRQSRQLEILSAGQSAITDRLQQLRQHLHEEVNRVIQTINDVEDRKVEFEYQRQVNRVVAIYHEMQQSLLDGSKPDGPELGRLVSASDDLESWAKTKSEKTQPGDPARLPYRVAQALAIRARSDARTFEKGEKQGHRKISALLADISSDVFELCDGKSLYWIGVEIPDVIAQYVYLYRGLKASIVDSQGSDRVGVPMLSTKWDDGLAPLRTLFSGPTVSTSAWLPIRSLRDFIWYTEWAGLDPDIADVAGITSVDLLAVAYSLGSPKRPVSRNLTDIQTLLAIALPIFRHQAQARLLKTFEWQKVPNVGLPKGFQEAIALSAKTKLIFEELARQEALIDARLKEQKRVLGALDNVLPAEFRRYSLAELSDTAIAWYLAKMHDQEKDHPEVFHHPGIPPKKLASARESMGIPAGEVVLALIDTTLLGGGSDGVAICRDRFFYHEFSMQPYFSQWKNLPALRLEKNVLYSGNSRISGAAKYLKAIMVSINTMTKLATDGLDVISKLPT